MDSHRFDLFTRTLSAGETRRGAVRILAAAGLGLGLTRFGLAEVDGRRRKRRKKRKNKRKNKNKKGNRQLSEVCKKTKQCQGDLLCKVSNSQNSCFPTNEKRCCIVEGDPCEDSCDCCGLDVICNGGFCQNA